MLELKDLKGIGEGRLAALHRANIRSVQALILTLPSSYRDMTKDTPVGELVPGMTVCVTGCISRTPKLSRFKGLSRVTAAIRDESGTLPLQWYNQPWIKDNLPEEGEVTLYGSVMADKNGKLLMNGAQIVHERAILPVYKALKDIPGKTLQQILKQALEQIDECCPETLPEFVRMKYGLCERNFALRQAHFPLSMENLAIALRRLSFEGMLFYQAATVLMRGEKEAGAVIAPGRGKEFLQSLPFPSTGAQARVLDEIEADMASPAAMNRLVQGDVGCGKTAVAFAALYGCVKSGFQGIMMAPTEILARQHMESAKAQLEPLGVRCGLLLGGMKAKERREALAAIASGEWQVIFGTHALLSESVEYAAPGLIVTDEQHRFGVKQRGTLSKKSALKPNALVMSATPIPRSLALVLYGDLDISVVNEMPPGRTPVKTRVVPEEKRGDMYRFIADLVHQGRQAYIVCPMVEESETLDAKSAKETYAALCTGPLSQLRLGLTWGGQGAKEKEKVLGEFVAGSIDVLVATTVVEVGVNVPNASVMVIENADRFGLSQLHQLRGRVGRGAEVSWCFLMAKPNERLKTLCETSDGFEVAKKDLEMRGPGDFLGTRQHGTRLLPGMNFMTDTYLLEQSAACVRLLQTPGYEEEWETVKENARALFRETMEDIAMN
ncbi:MAG: ATP-dependent DNA helicase RecG [Clostridiales bacterium]|nr:ATP-dependent DNA helicase RecG [Clostridiales bacterium]